MTVLLALPILVANVLLTLRDARAGVFLYAGLAFLLPHPSIGGAAVPYEMLALPAVVLAVVYVTRKLEHPRVHLMLAAYLAVVLLSTVVGTTTYGTELSAVRILGFLRALVLIGLFCEMFDRRRIETLLLVVLAANALIGFAQLVLPGGAELFLRLYGREGANVLERYVEWGGIPRASGTFSTPLILGSLALIGVAVGWSRLLSGETRRSGRTRALLLVSGIAGIVSITKTFILGAPIVLAAGVGVRMWQQAKAGTLRPAQVGGVFAVVVAGLGITVWAARYLASRGLPVGYAVGFLTEPFSALTGRYGPGGFLEDAVSVIRENIVVGVGLTKVRGEFLGDSLYVSMLHGTGLVGLAIGALAATFVTLRNLAAGRALSLLVLLALLLTGFSIDVVFKLPGAVAIAYLVALPVEPGKSVS